MITVFNRAELFLTYSMREQSNIRALLKAGDMEYVVEAKSLGEDARRNMGSSQNLECAIEYRIFVRKKDLDRAKEALSRRKNK